MKKQHIYLFKTKLSLWIYLAINVLYLILIENSYFNNIELEKLIHNKFKDKINYIKVLHIILLFITIIIVKSFINCILYNLFLDRLTNNVFSG